MNTEIIGKRMQLLREVVAGARSGRRPVELSQPDSCPLLAGDRAGSPRAWGWSFNLSKRGHQRISRRHLRLPPEASAGRSSRSMMRSHITTDPGSLRWPPQADFPPLYGYREFPDEAQNTQHGPG